jgi:hypothetical protein
MTIRTNREKKGKKGAAVSESEKLLATMLILVENEFLALGKKRRFSS